jgi:hypothetical protein
MTVFLFGIVVGLILGAPLWTFVTLRQARIDHQRAMEFARRVRERQ